MMIVMKLKSTRKMRPILIGILGLDRCSDSNLFLLRSWSGLTDCPRQLQSIQQQRLQVLIYESVNKALSFTFVTIYRQALCVCAVNSGTSFFSGFAVFSIIGYMAKQQEKSIEEVALSGTKWPISTAGLRKKKKCLMTRPLQLSYITQWGEATSDGH